MSGNNELNQLQQQRQDLIEERERLEADLPRLENALKQAPTGWHLGNMVGSEEKQAASDALSSVRARINSIDFNLREIDKSIAYLDSLAGADDRIALAIEQEKAAAVRIASITESLERVRGHLEQMRSNTEQSLQQAKDVEVAAAQEMARATASGDKKAAKAAQAKIDAASTAAKAARASAEANAPLVAALEEEAAGLAEQLAEAHQAEQAAQEEHRDATCIRLGAEWDRAAAALGKIGTQLVAQGMRDQLRGLKLPTFAPGSLTITVTDLSA
ncbi:hypothetical protein [Pseudomonas aeruginosa]|uniref:hypothetical protein n=1 Tax=Pseudomonas aeruginosa TaxID=287 RepID=UPI000EAC3A78|nr:hypothetical protein [Pseudomonas aeruginosa]